MAKDKKSFLLYADIIYTIEHLTNEEKGRLFQHLLEYINDQNPILEDRLLLIAWKPIERQLKRDLQKYEDKKEERRRAGMLGNLKKYNEDLFNKVSNNELSLDEALSIADIRRASLSDDSDSCASQEVAKPADNVTDNVTVTVNGTVTETDIKKEKKEKKEKHEKNKERDISPPPIMQDEYTYRNVESDFPLNNQNANNNFEYIDWRAFCEMFNKETGKSVNAILPRTKQNIEQLMKIGYTKQHLVKAIHKAKENEYIKKNPKLLTPTHIFEPENFERYVT